MSSATLSVWLSPRKLRRQKRRAQARLIRLANAAQHEARILAHCARVEHEMRQQGIWSEWQEGQRVSGVQSGVARNAVRWCG